MNTTQPATLGHGKVAPCQILCWFVFYVAEEGNGYDVRSQDVHLNLTSIMRIWVSCCPLLFRWTIALKMSWKPLLMMLGECGKSLMSTTFPSVKLNRMVESASQWICLNL